MREYGTISPGFWIGETGKALRGCAEAQVVAIYLLSSPHANMLGLYYLPLAYLCHETGLLFEGASKGLRRCIEGGFCQYDEGTEFVWVTRMVEYQVGTGLKPADNRCKGVQAEYDKLPPNPFLSDFFERYEASFFLTSRREFSKPLRSPFEAPSKPGTGTGAGTVPSSLCSEGSAELPLAPSAPPLLVEPVLLAMPCVGTGSKGFVITSSMVSQWQDAYPGVDVLGEAKKAKAWLEANPKKGKTASGMARFLVNWFSRAQDAPRPMGGARASPIPLARRCAAADADHQEQISHMEFPTLSAAGAP